MEKKTLRRADLVMSIILILFAIFVFVMSMQLMNRTLNLKNEDNAVWYRSAGLIPMIVSVLLAISSIGLFTTARRDGAKFDFFTGEKVKVFFGSREFRVAGFVIAWLAVYIFILLGPVEEVIYNALYAMEGIHWMIVQYLPYVIMTFIYLFVFIMVFSDRTKRKEWINGVVISLICSVVIAYLFGDVAMIILP